MLRISGCRSSLASGRRRSAQSDARFRLSSLPSRWWHCRCPSQRGRSRSMEDMHFGYDHHPLGARTVATSRRNWPRSGWTLPRPRWRRWPPSRRRKPRNGALRRPTDCVPGRCRWNVCGGITKPPSRWRTSWPALPWWVARVNGSTRRGCHVALSPTIPPPMTTTDVTPEDPDRPRGNNVGNVCPLPRKIFTAGLESRVKLAERSTRGCRHVSCKSSGASFNFRRTVNHVASAHRCTFGARVGRAAVQCFTGRGGRRGRHQGAGLRRGSRNELDASPSRRRGPR